MNVWQVMLLCIQGIHPDDDAVKHADGRHGVNSALPKWQFNPMRSFTDLHTATGSAVYG